MEFIKKFLGLLTLIVALVLGFYLVSIAAPFDFMNNYIFEDWFLKLGEYVSEWGISVLVVLGMSRMLAVNNKIAIFISIIVYVLLSVLVIMSLHYPDQLANILSKVGIK